MASPSLLVSARLTVDILSTFCNGFAVQCVKLMLSKFLHMWFLLFDCFACRQNLSSQTFYQVRHYTGEMEDIIIARLATVS